MSAALENKTVELPNDELKAVLADFLKENKFKSYNLLVTSGSNVGDNYMGVIYRIKVTGIKMNGSYSKLNLIMKVPPPSLLVREKLPVPALYKREVMAYNAMFTELCKVQKKYISNKNTRFQPAKCYKASDENLKEYLLLEDLAEFDFKMHDRKVSLTVEHLKLIVQSLANFHGLSFALKKLNPARFKELADFDSFDMTPEHAPMLDLARKRCVDTVPNAEIRDKINADLSDFMAKLKYYLDPETVDDYVVVCHGDCWINNMLFKYENGKPTEMRFLDWQCLKICSPITDLAYAIFSGTDEDIRKECFDHLMDLYFTSLKTKLKSMDLDVEDCYPHKVFKSHLSKILPYGIIAAMIILPAISGEEGDTPDVDAFLSQEVLQDISFGNQKSTDRLATRFNGVVNDFVRMKML